LTIASLALPEVYGVANMQRFAKRDPACTPQFYLVSMYVDDLLVFGLHIGPVGTAVDQKEIFMLASDDRVATRCEFATVDKIVGIVFA